MNLFIDDFVMSLILVRTFKQEPASLLRKLSECKHGDALSKNVCKEILKQIS